METKTLERHLANRVEIALGKGLVTPSFKIEFESQKAPCGHYSWKPDANGTPVWDYIFEASVERIFERFDEALAKVEPLADRQRREYLKRLASAIEYGRSIDIDDDFINPLMMQMKKLSDNIIEHHPVTDEIPF